jgi:hypothetical protein
VKRIRKDIFNYRTTAFLLNRKDDDTVHVGTANKNDIFGWKFCARRVPVKKSAMFSLRSRSTIGTGVMTSGGHPRDAKSSEKKYHGTSCCMVDLQLESTSLVKT